MLALQYVWNLVKQLPWWGPVLEAYGINSADDMGRVMAGDTWLWEKPKVFEDQWTKAAEEQGLSLLKVCFEDIINDKAGYIRQIANFVGLEIKRPVEDIIADTSVEQTIKRKGNIFLTKQWLLLGNPYKDGKKFTMMLGCRSKRLFAIEVAKLIRTRMNWLKKQKHFFNNFCDK